jgi:hypothetical protein
MYRSSLDGLTEQIRSLEEQKRRLEADLVGMTRIRGPRRALRVAIAVLALAGAGLIGSVLGYRHAAIQLQEAWLEDVHTARWRVEQCHDRLRDALVERGALDPEWAARHGVAQETF